MNSLSIKYFLTLAKERNFTKAAERLYITQQTLSAHIAALEKETGGPLFLRHVPLELTGAGEVFYRYARLFAENETNLERELSEAHRNLSGTLRIGVAPARGKLLLPSVIDKYRRKFPHIRIRLIEDANDILARKLEERELDLAIIRMNRKAAGMERIPFYEEEIVLLAPEELLTRMYGKKKQKRISEAESGKKGWLENFRDCPVLLNGRMDIVGGVVRSLYKNAGFEPQVAVESENLETLLALCVKGDGLLFCVRNLAEFLLSPADREKVRVIPLPREKKHVISFIYEKRAHRWSMVDEFISLAQKEIHGRIEDKKV